MYRFGKSVLFSVVIPTYNRLSLLPSALDSVWRQRFIDYEIIVVDDGSEDGTRDYLQRQRDRLRVLRQSNLGPGAARNFGTNEARGEYVAFLDSDDLWPAWTLEIFADLIWKHNSPAILAGRLVEFRDERELEALRPEPVRAEFYSDYFSSFHTGYFVGAGMAVLRRDVLMDCGGFIEERANCEDHDLIFRLGTMPGFVQVLAPTTLGWRRHTASETAQGGRTFAGVLRMLEEERCAGYPGGASRARERQEILTRHVRPVSLDCLEAGLIREGWRLYRETFRWHTLQRRWQYLAAFPFLVLAAKYRSKGEEKVLARTRSSH